MFSLISFLHALIVWSFHESLYSKHFKRYASLCSFPCVESAYFWNSPIRCISSSDLSLATICLLFFNISIHSISQFCFQVSSWRWRSCLKWIVHQYHVMFVLYEEICIFIIIYLSWARSFLCLHCFSYRIICSKNGRLFLGNSKHDPRQFS